MINTFYLCQFQKLNLPFSMYVNKKTSKKNTIFFSADKHLGGRVIKMAVICERVVIWLQLCVDMIA